MVRACFKPKSQQLWYGVYAAARRIPRGRVATYADLARAIGCPRAWRHVGTVLSLNRDPKTPCHRVVRSDGRVGGFSAGGRTGGTLRKIEKLRAEGIRVTGERVDLRRYRIRSPRSFGIRF
ncbi:MAG: MGMT family protein [bacterium]|nr:MGMT family protein [bacterium]